MTQSALLSTHPLSTHPLSAHPRHGIDEPTHGMPPSGPGSMRRTATTDMLRPEGIGGPRRLVGRARDLFTHADGTAVTVGIASGEAVIEFLGGRVLQSPSTDPHRPVHRRNGRAR